uniref:C-type lectin domain family 4 member G n=1 Tax=Otolemur garnettii TaxID=30611 RepID=H0WS94_OTOGA
GCWKQRSQRSCFLALVVLVGIILWALILSILLSSGRGHVACVLAELVLLNTTAKRQTGALETLKEEVRACSSCCDRGLGLGLKCSCWPLREKRAELTQQESALEELCQHMTQGLAEGRNRENVRHELFRVLEAVKLQSSSCNLCPSLWLSFEGSCYYFLVSKATWTEAQRHYANAGTHLAIVRGIDEQIFLTQNTHGQGYWLGLRAVGHQSKIQGYRWVDGVPLSFSHWNHGEPSDSWGLEDCVMLLYVGMIWCSCHCCLAGPGWIRNRQLGC